MSFDVPDEVIESIARQNRERCVTCGLPRYEHIDHAHAALVQRDGRCPFGDCAAFLSQPDGGAA